MPKKQPAAAGKKNRGGNDTLAQRGLCGLVVYLSRDERDRLGLAARLAGHRAMSHWLRELAVAEADRLGATLPGK